MNANLVKAGDGRYFLFNQDEDNPKQLFYKLSVKNCDDIFGVFNVESFASEFASQSMHESGKNDLYDGFIEGFNKKTELSSDLQFSLNDVIRIAEYCRSEFDGLMKTSALVNEYLDQKKLQDNTIKVTIRTEDSESYDDNLDKHKKPILDEEGCVILIINDCV